MIQKALVKSMSPSIYSKFPSFSCTFNSPFERSIIKSSLLHRYSTPRYRAFNQSTPRPFIHEALQTTHHIIQSIHSISGTPWSLTIPIIALIIRISISLPIGIIQQRASIQRVKLIPILHAWKHSFRKETLQQFGHQGPIICQKNLNLKMQNKRKELFKRYHCGRWKMFLGAFQVPFFLGILDVIRRMADVEYSSLITILNQGIETSHHALIPVEPGLATEGTLWFPNLMVADPQLVLPFILSGTLLLNIFATKKSYLPLGKWQKRFRRGMGVVALCVGPMFINLPSALMLYWITNSSLNFIQYWVLEWFIPIPRPIQPLAPKRPWNSGICEIEIENAKNNLQT